MQTNERTSRNDETRNRSPPGQLSSPELSVSTISPSIAVNEDRKRDRSQLLVRARRKGSARTHRDNRTLPVRRRRSGSTASTAVSGVLLLRTSAEVVVEGLWVGGEGVVEGLGKWRGWLWRIEVRRSRGRRRS